MQPGDHIRHYRVVRLIGDGGMGQVWEGWDEHLNRRGAIKCIREEQTRQPERLLRLQQETQHQARLKHPAIGEMYACERQQGHLSLVREFIEGRSREEIVRDEGSVPILQAMEWFRQLAQALVYPTGRSLGNKHPAHLVS